MKSTSQPIVKTFFDPVTWTFTHVVYEAINTPCIIIDSVLNYDPKSGRTSTHSADEVIQFVKESGLQCQWILETHAHADHVSAAPYLQTHLGGKIAIGNQITKIQTVFKDIFHLESSFPVDGSQFDALLVPDEIWSFGNLECKAIFVPGHTPACVAYQVGDAIFVGDTLFMPDVGTARCDFPGGNAEHLYQSIQKILSNPPETRLFMCHDYPPTNRPVAYLTTVREEQQSNIHVHEGVSGEAFVAMRTKRDQTLDMPVLILPSIQINIRAGHLPPPEENGVSYLKIPLNQL